MRGHFAWYMIVGVLILLIRPASSAIGADPYADAVIFYAPGGGGLAPCLSPETCLGVPEGSPHIECLIAPPGTFISLGIAGSISLTFVDNLVVDGPGSDLRVNEVGSRERGDVWVSNDWGATFLYLGDAVGTTEFDLEDTNMHYINAIRIIDDGIPAMETSLYAGFDLDGATGLNWVEVVDVAVCIKPGSDANGVGADANGFTSVAVVGTADFNAVDVNPVGMVLTGRSVADPNAPKESFFQDVDGDGDMDLLVPFTTSLMGNTSGGELLDEPNGVIIDFKPGNGPAPSDPNSLVPVAILTTEAFDAASVDPSTLTFTGHSAAKADEAGTFKAYQQDVDGDGDIDFLILFKIRLMGFTFDGQPIGGYDGSKPATPDATNEAGAE